MKPEVKELTACEIYQILARYAVHAARREDRLEMLMLADLLPDDDPVYIAAHSEPYQQRLFP